MSKVHETSDKLPEERGSALLWLALMFASFWPIWSWYWTRMTDGSDEPWGVMSLVLAGFMLWRTRPRNLCMHGNSLPAWVLAASGTYLLCYSQVPMLARGFIAVLIVGGAARAQGFISRGWLAWMTLCLLSLPLISSLEFFLGYPFRFVLTQLVALVIRWVAGLDVHSSGTALQYGGSLVVVDAPCSGIHMIWAASALTAFLASWRGLDTVSTLRAFGYSMRTVFLGNFVRTTLLFFKESGLWKLPPWTHSGIGVVCFAAVVILILRRFEIGFDGRTVVPSRSSPVPMYPCTCPRLRFAICASFCCFAPFASVVNPAAASNLESRADFPSHFQGVRLVERALRPADARFAKDFPGEVKAFDAGHRQVILRWVRHATRKLHPASDCFQGLGYRITHQPLMLDSDGARWSCFIASRGESERRVCERIYDFWGHSFSDVSQWYWNGLMGWSKGPWWSVTVIE